MLEIPSVDSSAAAVNIATVKRYAPPNQRNRLLGRRKSVGEPASTYANDGEKNHISSTKANSMVDHGDAGVNKLSGEIHCSRLIPLHGCSDSEAFQLLNNRWTAVMSAYNNLGEDSVERPVLYTKKSASAWGQAFLPHLPTVSSGLRRDLSSELQQAMNNANSGL
ncbi:uncharacterized protein LOC142549777 isoform X1 [Primulina tabacum]|uniref:uncharacterized protein LOC142549777 isoform X1 n=1 Tax=Primulina tabacum TaxID=48773 RepID=UPI003F595012